MIPIPEPERYEYSPDRNAADLDDILTYYRENGAPQHWLDETKPVIENALTDVNNEREAEFSATNPQSAAQYQASLERHSGDQIELWEQDIIKLRELMEPGLFDGTQEEVLQRLGDIVIRDEPTMPHHMIDQLAEMRFDEMRALELDLEYDDLSQQIERSSLELLEPYEERSGKTGRYLTHDNNDRATLVALVREDTTDEEFDLIRRGDIRGLERLTDNETFARQLLDAYKIEMTHHGVEFTPEMGRNFAQNDRELTDTFKQALDNDFELGR